MKCPKCNSKTIVTDVRHPQSDENLRRRKCTACERIFYTIEYEVEMTGEFIERWSRSDRPRNRKKRKDKKNDQN